MWYCKPCPPGYYCPYGTADKQACPAGSWSLGAQEFCTLCLAGFECPDTTAPTSNPCMLGRYTDVPGKAACDICPQNYECIGKTKVPCWDPVADGARPLKWSRQGEGRCRFFEAGTYPTNINPADVTTYTPATCAVGKFAPYGTGVCYDCPIGHECPSPDQPPKKCTPGKYAGSTGMSACVNCANNGEYSLFGASMCQSNPAGFSLGSRSELPKQCPYGKWSQGGVAGGYSNCNNCSNGIGYMCKAGSTTSTPTSLCPAGMYCDRQNYSPSTSGTFIPARGQKNSAGGGVSSASSGYYAPRGSWEEYLCPPGHYCASGSAKPTPCPSGKYNNNYGKSSAGDCTSCPSGFYCPLGATFPVQCSAGDNCAAGGASTSSAVTCAAGTYSGGKAASGSCRTCPTGYYCPAASSFPIPCPAGKYNDLTGKSLLSDCKNSDANIVQPWLGYSRSSTPIQCPYGSVCPVGTASPYQTVCPDGTYASSAPLSTTGSCTACPAGYACSGGASVYGKPMEPCAPGYYCPLSSSSVQQTACPAGTYSAKYGNAASTDCTPCPSGFYCLAGTIDPTLTPCPVSKYCPEGTSTAAAVTCDPGTYTDITGTKAKSQCKICPEGNYCPAGIAIQCPAGTYSNRVQLAILVDLPGGSPQPAANRGCYDCPAGYSCPTAGTVNPTPCAAGYYSDVKALACVRCDDGHFCEMKGTSKAQMLLNDCTTLYKGFTCRIKDSSGNLIKTTDVNGVNTYYGIDQRPFHISTYSCPPGNTCDGKVAT